MLRRTFTAIALVTVCLAAGVLSTRDSEAITLPATYIVDTTSDNGALNACTIFNHSDCSLRGAINNANTHTGFDYIFFGISPSGIQTISPTAALPDITGAVDIDATGQAAGVDNCGVGIMPCIRLDGSNLGAGVDGLKISAGAVTVRGLAIVHFSNGSSSGIRLTAGSNDTIAGNFIGTADGTTAAGNKYGIFVGNTVTNVTIGGTAAADRNLISGSENGTVDGDGVFISGSNSVIEGNYIGTTKSGDAALGNFNGIFLDGNSAGNTIGGTATGAGNLISGNVGPPANMNGAGIAVGGTGTQILGNLIGTDATGLLAIPNVYGIHDNFGSHTTVGGASATARNVISGNLNDGISLYDEYGGTVSGNYIGVDVTGNGRLANQGSGISAIYEAFETIGGAGAGDRNVISGNQGAGIALLTGGGLQLTGNYIGLDAAGAPLGNEDGVTITAANANEPVSGYEISQNVISGNSFDGIKLLGQSGGAVSGNNIFGNIIGLNPAGDSSAPNTNGVEMTSDAGTVTGNQIGGTGAGQPNVISGNGSDGIAVSGGSTTNNSISGNYIGTTADGTQPMGNQQNGILFSDANGSVMGNTISSNLISGNEHDGVRFDGAGVHSNGVVHNLIGTDVTGRIPIVTQGNGISVFGSTNNEFQYNTITGGEQSEGVALGLGATGNSFRLNYIGTNANGDAGLGGALNGVYINGAPGNEIGGEAAPPSVDGAYVESAAGGGNYIWNSLRDGIRIDGAAATGNTISGNSIDNNGGLGIDLFAGGNGNAAAPVLTSALTTGGNTEVHGSYTNDPQHDFTAEFFASPACDPSGNGEGRDFLGAATIHTDGSGIATFAATVPGSTAGKAITATVTIPGNGNTSEFSNCVTSAGPTATPSPTPSPTHSPTATPHATPTPTATPSGLKGDANCDGKVDMTDMFDTLSQTGGVPPGAACPGRADVNCNSQVDADDALRILLYAAGTPMTQPSGCGQIGFQG